MICKKCFIKRTYVYFMKVCKVFFGENKINEKKINEKKINEKKINEKKINEKKINEKKIKYLFVYFIINDFDYSLFSLKIET